MTRSTAKFTRRGRQTEDGGVRARGNFAAPDVASILDVDREYRETVAMGRVEKRHGSRFDSRAEGVAPMLQTHRRQWLFTASYSNSEACHALHRDHDWVVIHYENESGSHGLVTVVTAMQSPIRGLRIVRGAEEMPPAHGVAKRPTVAAA